MCLLLLPAMCWMAFSCTALLHKSPVNVPMDTSSAAASAQSAAEPAGSAPSAASASAQAAEAAVVGVVAVAALSAPPGALKQVQLALMGALRGMGRSARQLVVATLKAE